MEKHATFSQVEKIGNAVRLRNVKHSISFSDQDGYDVVCSCGTSVEVTRLQFMRFSVPSCRRMSVAEVKALSLKQKVGEVRGKARLDGSLSRMVTVNGSDCELKEVLICDGTGEISATLWDSFVNQAEGGNSYVFKNLSVRESICLCTGLASTIEQIADFDVPEGEGGKEKMVFQRHYKGRRGDDPSEVFQLPF